MTIKLVTIILLLIGILCLSIAVLPTRQICGLEKKHRVAWRCLGALILLFLAGYLYYGSLLIIRPARVHDLLISIIMAAGGIFVILVPASACRRLKP